MIDITKPHYTLRIVSEADNVVRIMNPQLNRGFLFVGQ